MKTKATKKVKDESAQDSVEDECNHMLSDWLHEPDFEGSLDPELHERLTRVCEDVVSDYADTPFPTAERLEREVTKKLGRLLHHCTDRELSTIVVNIVIRAVRVRDEIDLE